MAPASAGHSFRRAVCLERSGDESARHRPLAGRAVARRRGRPRFGGPPQLQLHGGAARRFDAMGGRSSLLTITHSDALALAEVIVLGALTQPRLSSAGDSRRSTRGSDAAIPDRASGNARSNLQPRSGGTARRYLSLMKPRRTHERRSHLTIKITPNDKGNPPGKLADAELHFTDGPLEGLKLIGFSIWERRGGSAAATSPSRRGNTASTASAAASRCCGRSSTRRRRTRCAS